MILAKVLFGEEFFPISSDLRTLRNVCELADFSCTSSYFETVYVGF